MLTVTRKIKVLFRVLSSKAAGKVSLREPRLRWKDLIEVNCKEVDATCDVAK